MTHYFSPPGACTLDPELGVLRKTLSDLNQDLLRVHNALRAEDWAQFDEATQVYGHLRQCIRLALLMEADFEERDAKQGHAARSSPLDLDAARTSIRCRLDRLRTCRGSGGFSGQSE
ncbi:hypothetical protein J7399_11430 [Shimia sp. R9_1]|uniref:hypothetical protein n=1 Tax=Shimia sp. R9_1 TaxID=2821111 RepID=UPI001AD990F5|nr:hypothetical protein [Shimia sp. R9_1]MBO9408042.1 hypothetical protein [Shimia sp. R9_1]